MELQSPERKVSKQSRVFQTSTPKFLDQRGTAHAHRQKSDRKARQHHHPRYLSVEVGALYTLGVKLNAAHSVTLHGPPSGRFPGCIKCFLRVPQLLCSFPAAQVSKGNSQKIVYETCETT